MVLGIEMRCTLYLWYLEGANVCQTHFCIIHKIIYYVSTPEAEGGNVTFTFQVVMHCIHIIPKEDRLERKRWVIEKYYSQHNHWNRRQTILWKLHFLSPSLWFWDSISCVLFRHVISDMYVVSHTGHLYTLLSMREERSIHTTVTTLFLTNSQWM